jgi:hypothetical protein
MDDKFLSIDKKLESLSKNLDKIRPIDFTIDVLDDLFPFGYHIMDITWVGDEYVVDQRVSEGYQQAYEYTKEELPLTMESKYSVAKKEEVDESNLKFDQTIRTGECTSGYITVKHKSGVNVKYYYRNTVVGTKGGKTKTIFGYQVRC